jgi:hypothetical protein
MRKMEMAAEKDSWNELMNAGFGMAGTVARAGEMIIASSSVVSARMTIMGSAALSPAEGDFEEIGGMLPEKVIAFSKAGEALFDQWSAMVTDATEQTHHLSQLVSGGRFLDARDLSELVERWLAHGTRLVTRTMETGGLALAPVHLQATENARRLG